LARAWTDVQELRIGSRTYASELGVELPGEEVALESARPIHDALAEL